MSQPTSPMFKLNDEKKEAERIGFSVRTLQSWRLRGDGPPYFKIHASVRYRPDLTDAWIESQLRAHTSQGVAA